MKQNRGMLGVAAVLMVVAFSLTWQYRSIRDGALSNSTALARAETLQTQLTAEREKNEALYSQLLSYKDEMQKMTDAAKETGGYAAILSKQLEEAQISAGMTRVTGPGVVVTLSDSQQRNTAGDDENYFVIHDEDLLLVVNELWDAGAEAVSINGERLVGRSEIRCTGATVSVNGSRYAAPYTIRAIGNTKELSDALTMRGGQVEMLSVWGISCSISREASLTIDAYNGASKFNYAKTVK